MDLTTLSLFIPACFALNMAPGPNNLLSVSNATRYGYRQSCLAGAGRLLAFAAMIALAAAGLAVVLQTSELLFQAIKILGAGYLLYLAWQALRPGGRSPFQVKDLPADSPRRLFTMGFATSLLNPKIAVMYLSLMPQFIEPGHGSVLVQSLVLGSTQIAISVSVNALIAIMAGSIAVFLAGRPLWQQVQRWLMGTVLAGLAVRMLAEGRR